MQRGGENNLDKGHKTSRQAQNNKIITKKSAVTTGPGISFGEERCIQ